MGCALDQILMVGDDLEEDYLAATRAGLQAVLLNRYRHEADYVRKEMQPRDLQDVRFVHDLSPARNLSMRKDLPATL